MISIALGVVCLILGLALLAPFLGEIRRPDRRRRIDSGYFKALALDAPPVPSPGKRWNTPRERSTDEDLDLQTPSDFERDLRPTGLSGAPLSPPAPSPFEDPSASGGIGLPVREEDEDEEDDHPRQGTLGF